MAYVRGAEPSDAAIQRMARMAGLFFLLTVITGVYAQAFVSDRLIAADAGATAQNILANRGLLKTGYAVYLIEMACNIAMAIYFYVLLRPVSRSLSLLATAFSLVGCTIKALSRLFFIAPLTVLTDAQYAAAFEGGQLQALSHVLLRLNGSAAGMALVFFGFSALVRGYVMLRSTFLPRALGVLSMLGGLGWLTFLSPQLGMRLFPLVACVGLIGSVATIGWLLVKGVNTQRWREQADQL